MMKPGNYSGGILRRDASCGTVNLTPSPVENEWEGEAPLSRGRRPIEMSRLDGSLALPKEAGARENGWEGEAPLSRGRRPIEMSRLDGSLALPKEAGARENGWEGEAYSLST